MRRKVAADGDIELNRPGLIVMLDSGDARIRTSCRSR
jgi:hypothetical protein